METNRSRKDGKRDKVSSYLSGISKQQNAMRIIGRLIPVFAFAILFGAVSVPTVSASTHMVPFQSTYSGTITPAQGPPPLVLSGKGVASQLGASTNQGYIVVSGPANCAGGFATTHTETLTSTDDGSTINLTISDISCPVSPGSMIYHGQGTYVVTSGTGRFAGASGSGTFDGHGNFNTGTYTITLTGTISQPLS